MQSKFTLFNTRMSPIYRCLIFWVLFMGLLFLSGSFLVPMFPKRWSSWIYGILGTISAYIATVILLKYDKRSFADIWLKFESHTIVKFLIGCFIGIVLCTIMFSLLLAFTDLRIHKNTVSIDVWAIVGYLAFFPLGLMEELAFRGYPFVILFNKYNIRITQMIIAIAFALYHVIGGQEFIGSFLGPGVWAFTFGYAAIRSKGIALPLGLHMALNVVQSMIGMKGTEHAIWLVDFKSAPTAVMIADAQRCGIIMHIVLLILGVALTELYIRRQVKRAETALSPTV